MDAGNGERNTQRAHESQKLWSPSQQFSYFLCMQIRIVSTHTRLNQDNRLLDKSAEDDYMLMTRFLLCDCRTNIIRYLDYSNRNIQPCITLQIIFWFQFSDESWHPCGFLSRALHKREIGVSWKWQRLTGCRNVFRTLRTCNVYSIGC